jgi:lambda repressor-like predicted transcriptional regulator
MATRQQRADAELRRALADARRAIERVLDREHCRISDVLATEIEQIWTGRFYLRPKQASPEYCPNHPHTRTPCGLCPPLHDGDNDD